MPGWNSHFGKVNGGNSGQWVTPDSDSSCSELAAADTPAGGKASPPPHAASLTSGGVGGGRFAARTVAVRSYPLSGVPPIYLTYIPGISRIIGSSARDCARFPCYFPGSGERTGGCNPPNPPPGSAPAQIF